MAIILISGVTRRRLGFVIDQISVPCRSDMAIDTEQLGTNNCSLQEDGSVQVCTLGPTM